MDLRPVDVHTPRRVCYIMQIIADRAHARPHDACFRHCSKTLFASGRPQNQNKESMTTGHAIVNYCLTHGKVVAKLRLQQRTEGGRHGLAET